MSNGSSIWLKIIGICSIGIAITFLVSAFCMFQIACSHDFDYDKTVSPDNKDITGIELRDVHLCDSVVTEKILQTICDNHKYLIYRHNELLSDVRQETNNNLNKLNSWFSFWIGMLAVFGVLAPIVAEYRYRIANKEELDRIKEDIRKTVTQYKAHMASIEVEGSINALSLSHDERLTSGIAQRGKLMGIMFKYTLSSLSRLIKEIEDSNHSTNSRQRLDVSDRNAVLLRAFISLYALLQKLKIINSHSRIRLIENAQEKLKSLIVDIANHNDDDFEEIFKRIKELFKDLNEIYTTV